MREVDEIHQAEGDGQSHGQHEEQHAVGEPVEQDREHADLSGEGDGLPRGAPFWLLDFGGGLGRLGSLNGSFTLGTVSNSTL